MLFFEAAVDKHHRAPLRQDNVGLTRQLLVPRHHPAPLALGENIHGIILNILHLIAMFHPPAFSICEYRKRGGPYYLGKRVRKKGQEGKGSGRDLVHWAILACQST